MRQISVRQSFSRRLICVSRQAGILHFGAKKRDAGPHCRLARVVAMADERAMVTFLDVADLNAKAVAFTAVVRKWIRHV